MKIFDSLADEFLGNAANEVSRPNRHVIRKEKKGYTVFLNEPMQYFYIDNLSYLFLKCIDGARNGRQIAKAVSCSSKLPYLVACKLLPRYIKTFSELGFIAGNPAKNVKPFKLKKSGEFIPTAPNQIAVLLTNQCNLRCSHCGNENRSKKDNELTKEEWFKIIDEAAKIGVFIFNASGGEPFIRKDWYEILSYARSKGIEVSITSNSTLIDDDIATKLKEMGIFNIHLSLDGVGKVHDFFRNQEGVFAKVENAIRLLKKHKVPFGITSAMSKRNFHNLDELADFIQKNNITSWEIYFAIPLGCMDPKEALEPAEILEFAKKIHRLKTKLTNTKIFIGDNLGYFDSLKTQENWDGCKAGIGICAIDSEGNVKGCPIHPNCLIQGNVRKEPLFKIWNRKDAFGYNRGAKTKLTKQCGKCKHAAVCRGGCKASMYAYHKSFDYNDHCLKYIEETRAKKI